MVAHDCIIKHHLTLELNTVGINYILYFPYHTLSVGLTQVHPTTILCHTIIYMCVFIHVTVIVRVQDEDYRIFFVNSYSAIARKVICAVR